VDLLDLFRPAAKLQLMLKAQVFVGKLAKAGFSLLSFKENGVLV